MTSRHIPITGGCLCGAVRYESRDPPSRGYICHCAMCRRNCGGPFGATLRFPGSAFELTKGELKAGVPGSRHAGVGLSSVHDPFAERRGDVRRVVRRFVVDDDDLDGVRCRRKRRLPEHALHRGAQEPALAITRNDHADDGG